MTDAEHAVRIAAIKAQRAAAGKAPTIQSESVYRLLSAVVDANAHKR